MSGFTPKVFYTSAARQRELSTEEDHNRDSDSDETVDVLEDPDSEYHLEEESDSDEIEVEERGLEGEGSPVRRRNIARSRGTPIQRTPGSSRTPSPSTSWLQPPRRRARSRSPLPANIDVGENIDVRGNASRPRFRTGIRRQRRALVRARRTLRLPPWEWMEAEDFVPFEEEFDETTSGIHGDFGENKHSDFFNFFFLMMKYFNISQVKQTNTSIS